MSAANVEAFLARIYVDEKSREKFLNDPDEEAKRGGLSVEECEAVKQIDRVGLAMMATSIERKKQKKRQKEEA